MIAIASLTLDQRTEISNAYSAGNYANSYETNDLDACDQHVEMGIPHERIAFILGFFASYELDEIPGESREDFDSAYHSEIGRYVVRSGYCDSRADEYAAEERAFAE